MKEFQIIYQFSDVIGTIEAENEEEARKKAEDALISDNNPQNDTSCYYIDIEEIK